jgi:hypothetical protein
MGGEGDLREDGVEVTGAYKDEVLHLVLLCWRLFKRLLLRLLVSLV